MREQASDGVGPRAADPPAVSMRSCRRRARSAVACTLVFVSGCVSYSPAPIEPFRELAQLEARASESQGLDVVPPGRAEWFPLRANVDLADGLDLGEANALALFHAPDIRAARSVERVSAAQLLQAGLLSNPELFFGPRVSTASGEWISPAGLSWELPLWGKRVAAQELADRRLSAARVRALDVELRVLTDVRSAFVRIARLTKSLEVIEAQSVASERVLAWVATLQHAGEVDAVTGYLARLEHDEARASLASTRHELASTTRGLLETVGILPGGELSLRLDPDPRLLPELPALDRTRLFVHPAMEAALAEYEAAEAALRLEVAEQYPAIRVGPELEDDRGDATLGIGVGIELPLFDRNRGGIIEAEELRDASRERYRTLLLRATHAEAQARAEWTVAERTLGDWRSGALASAERVRESLEVRFQSGESNVLEVLAALRALTTARLRELELESQSAVARFRAAVAGGAALGEPSLEDSATETR